MNVPIFGSEYWLLNCQRRFGYFESECYAIHQPFYFAFYFNILLVYLKDTHEIIFLIWYIKNSANASFCLWSVWPDWAIYCTLGNLSKPVARIYLPKSPTFFAIFGKASKSFIFLVQSNLGNFYRYLATFYWSHWM